MLYFVAIYWLNLISQHIKQGCHVRTRSKPIKAVLNDHDKLAQSGWRNQAVQDDCS